MLSLRKKINIYAWFLQILKAWGLTQIFKTESWTSFYKQYFTSPSDSGHDLSTFLFSDTSDWSERPPINISFYGPSTLNRWSIHE